MLVIEKNALTEEIEKYVEQFGKDRAALLEILHQIQKNTDVFPISRSRK